jgi:hypothetical protein
MLFREIITANYGNHTEHINTTLCVCVGGEGGQIFFMFMYVEHKQVIQNDNKYL